MNRGQIIDEIRRLILDTDTTNPRWSGTVLNDRLDLAHDRIATVSGCIVSRITDNLVSGTQEYDLPTYFLNVTAVAIQGQGSSQWTAIDKVSQEELANTSPTWMNDTGTPQKYFIRGNKIGLYPTPNYNQTSGIRVDITRHPTAFSSDSSIPFNGISSLYAYHSILAFDVARMCSMDEGNINKVQIFTGEVEKMLRQINYMLTVEEEATRMPNIYEQGRSAPRRVR